MRRRIAILLAALAAFITMGVGAAEAHPVYAYQGSDYGVASYGYDCDPNQTLCEHRKIGVHDIECDGNAVYVVYLREGAGGQYYSLWDRTGCGGLGESIGWPSQGYRVIQFKTCEENPAGADWCSAYVNVPALDGSF